MPKLMTSLVGVCFSKDQVTNCRRSAERRERQRIQDVVCEIPSAGIRANERVHV